MIGKFIQTYLHPKSRKSFNQLKKIITDLRINIVENYQSNPGEKKRKKKKPKSKRESKLPEHQNH